jgi:malonate transporter MadL subunit
VTIYGTSFLAFCVVCGLLGGRLLGWLLGLEANVGGVGVAMILLIVAGGKLQAKGLLGPATSRGVVFWSSIYIPVVVAMAASQNVAGALRGGPVAILAGVLSVVVCMVLVPVLSKIGNGRSALPDQNP